MNRGDKLRAAWANPQRRAQMLQHRQRTSAATRFAAFVAEDPATGCHLWIGARHASGYGFMHENGKPRLATHVSLERDGRPRPSPDHFALHRCDNPPCVNADHLFWGTHAENMADQQAKGRHWATVKPDCKRGHIWTAETTRIGADGRKNCRVCERDRLANRKATRAARTLAATSKED